MKKRRREEFFNLFMSDEFNSSARLHFFILGQRDTMASPVSFIYGHYTFPVLNVHTVKNIFKNSI